MLSLAAILPRESVVKWRNPSSGDPYQHSPFGDRWGGSDPCVEKCAAFLYLLAELLRAASSIRAATSFGWEM